MSEGFYRVANGHRRFVRSIVCVGVVAILSLLRMDDAGAQVQITQKISPTQGNFTQLLSDGDEFGGSLTNIGDLDNDGVDDLACSAWRDDYGDVNRGAVYILFMNADGTVRDRQKIGQGMGGFTGTLDQDDHFGTSVAGIGDLDGDGRGDLAVGAERDDEGGAGPNADWGAVWILFLNFDGTVKSHQKIAEGLGGFTGPLDDGDHFGHSVTGIGNLDGSGGRDIVVGAPGDDDGGTNAGAVWVLFLDTDGTVLSQQKITEASGGFNGLLADDDEFGSAVAMVGDLDGDTVTDIAIGASGDDTAASNGGAVWILFLDATGTVLSEQRITASLTAADDAYGSSVAYLGQHSPDGVEDIVVGAPGDDDGGTDRGAVWMVFLNDDGSVSSDMKISDIEGAFTGTLDDGDNFGSAVTMVADYNGDLVNDIVVGAVYDDDSVTDGGAAWVLFVQDDGLVTGQQKISQTEGGFSDLLQTDDWFGTSVALMGDLNGDGVNDVAVGENQDAGLGIRRGAVWILFLDDAGYVLHRQKIGNDIGGFWGELDDNDQFGQSVTAVGDLDGDGEVDIAVGATMDDTGGAGPNANRGAVYILFLRADGTVKGYQKIASQTGGFTQVLDDGVMFGYSLAFLGDLSDDGNKELAVGAINDNDGGTSRGAVWVLSLDTDGSVVAEQKISDTAGTFDGQLADLDWFGSSLAALGDVNGDAVPDIAVGAVGNDGLGGLDADRGTMWVLFLRDDGTVDSSREIGDNTGNFNAELQDDDAFGSSIAALGDLDGDGVTDLAVGAMSDGDGGPSRGAVYLLFIDSAGWVKTHGKVSQTEGNFGGVLGDSDHFGNAVAPLGDLNSDGHVDLLVGHFADDDGITESGSVWPLFLDEPDNDSDGVYYADDSCPGEDASYFDRNGDGCIDDPIGARHIEYWAVDNSELGYYIHMDGAPYIEDLTDFFAIDSAMAHWANVPNVDVTVNSLGTTDWDAAIAGDGENFVTFQDFDYNFGIHTLAVGVATSAVEPVVVNGRYYRPGEIIDGDMIFNPSKTFVTSGEGIDLESVATHEAGHLFGISHSPTIQSTMFYVLPSGTAARSLETEDVTIIQKAYPDTAWLPTASSVQGYVENFAGEVVPGAAVFLTDATTEDTVASDFTLPSGQFQLIGVPDGNYYLSIFPVNGTSPIGGLEADYINAMVDSTAITTFPAEFWNSGDSSDEDPLLKTSFTVLTGVPVPPMVIVTNVDTTGPEVIGHSPAHLDSDVGADAAVVIEFSEMIDDATVAGNFRLENQATGSGTGGRVVVTADGDLISFTPSGPLDYETTYICSLRAGLADIYGNSLQTPYVFEFTTELTPPLVLSSIVPNLGVPGSIVVFNGTGFDTIPSGNTVNFTDSSGAGTTTATVLNATATQLVVVVPDAVGSGDVDVQVGAFTSGAVSFTVITASDAPRGYQIGAANLNTVPRSVAVTPDGSTAYVATAAGVTVVDVDPKSGSFLATTSITLPLTGGTDELSVTPDGNWVYAVSSVDSVIHVIDAATNTAVDQLSVFAKPLGIVAIPSGNRAYVPTSEGEIHIWDIKQGSGTYRQQIGAITSPDPNLRGKTAVDPGGEYLFALAGTGKLLVFDVGPDTFVVDVSVGTDPRDVVIDRASQRAYVTDGMGLITIVGLSGFSKIMDIQTSGSLRGAAMTPTGSYLYAANRELNFIDIVDLIEGSSSYRSVAAKIPQKINPVDIEISPDGLYGFSLVEDDQQLIVMGIGSGPIIKSISRRAGPPGSMIVIGGEGFDDDVDSLLVHFTDPDGAITPITPTRSTRHSVTFPLPLSTPVGSASLSIERLSALGDATSNPVSFEVLGGTPAPGKVRPSSQTLVDPLYSLSETTVLSPIGDQLLMATTSGEILFLDTDRNSSTFNQRIHEVSFSSSKVTDLAMSPDGKRAYAVVSDDQAIYVINSDRSAGADYGTEIGTVDFGIYPVDTPREIDVSPDGRTCLLYDVASNLLYYIDIIPDSPTENAVRDTMGVGAVGQIVYHPRGTHAYLAMTSEHAITTVDVDSASGTFWSIRSTTVLPSPDSPPLPDERNRPLSLAFYPDGSRCLVLTDDEVNDYHYVYLLNTSNPDTAEYMLEETFGHAPAVPPPGLRGQLIDVSPRGDRAVFHQNGSGLFSFEISQSGFGTLTHIGLDVQSQGETDQDFNHDGTMLYSACTWGDSLQILDFQSPDTLFRVSGHGQTGVVSQTLPAKLRVRTVNGVGPAAGVAVTFQVSSGGGVFVGSNSATQIVATDNNGYAEVSWMLGPVVGSQVVSASALGLVGSPANFIANGVVDPNTLPLRLVDVSPADGATGVAATTTILATFSRGVDSLTVDTTSVFLHKVGETTAVRGEFGFTDEERKVSITPLSVLDFNATYTLEITDSVKDASGGLLENPTTVGFTTTSAPPLNLASVSPPSATVDVTLVLSGVGFNPMASQNKVFFNTTQAIPTDGAYEYLHVKLPMGAETGTVRVYNGADTSNALPFTVLVPSNASPDEVVATVGTNAATKAVTINPAGSMAYTVSPEGDMVIPIDLNTATSLPGITVGDHPISIDVHPDGSYVYVPNFNSSSVSIIDIDGNSMDYHKVVETVTVGSFPMDVVVHPDGSWVYVVNPGDSTQNVDIIDADEQSVNHHTVVATVGTKKTTRSITINPDGTRLYAGTDDGYVVLNSGDLSYSVVATVGTNRSTRSLTINPDGSLLFILTTEGDVLIVDIVQNSANENTVVATVSGGKRTRSITINPDGTMLYLIQEENDVIVVVGIDIQGAIGVIEGDGSSVPPFSVQTSVIDSIFAGEDPEVMVFDPTGSGLALVTNSGPRTVTFLNMAFVALELPADSIMVPAFSMTPSVDLSGFEMKNISGVNYSFNYIVSTVGPATLTTGTAASQRHGNSSRDKGHPGIAEGSDGALSYGPAIDAILAHSAGGDSTWVTGVTPVLEPGDSFAAGKMELLIPEIRTSVDQHVIYTVSPVENPNLVKKDTVFVTIDAPVPVFVSSFTAEALDAGVRLVWDVISDEAVAGFKIYRRMGGEEKTVLANREGLIAVEATEYVDNEAEPGRDYEYALGVVLADGEEVLSQPASVKTKKLTFGLRQNVPNPFNPTTTIGFTVPERGHVALTIYNVEGKRVATLVDEVMTAGNKRITWNGRNSIGNPVGSGVYFYRLQAGKRSLTKKMVLIR